MHRTRSFDSLASEGFLHSPVSKSPFHHAVNKFDSDEPPSRNTLWWLTIAGCFMNIVTKVRLNDTLKAVCHSVVVADVADVGNNRSV